MLIEIPVLIETVRHEATVEEMSGRFYRLRPVFFETPEVSNKNADLGLHEMTRQLRDHLRQLHRRGLIENLVRYSFAPEILLRNVDLAIELPRRFARVFLPIVQFESEDRRIGYCPLLPAPPFEFSGPDDFHWRAGEVYRKFFQSLRKKSGESVLDEKLREFSQPRHFRISQVECSLDPVRTSSRKTSRNRELLESGRAHLEETGLCLDSLYPKKLDHAMCRDEIVERVYRLLTDTQRQAILLVGPPKVGKTAIIHTVVSMMVQRLKRPRHDPNRQEVWQLTPGRLIAGMQMSGQWESRLNGIFALAEEKDLTLNFAQLIALLNTGKSAQGSLSMADMLLPALRRGRFRVVAEATEEQLRVLRERNRSLADQFEIVSIPEPSPEDNLRILLHAAREYEWNWGCWFEADLFPLLIEMTRQYENEAAMPGKAVHWLGSLAMQFQGENIDSRRFLDLFREKSGLRLSFFDSENYGATGRKPEEIEEWFGEKIIGQRRAIATLRDVIVLAESLLSDPERPVASLFFAGPTGVGKTECARQLARYFFDSEDRLLRFDANELCTASAVARLVGSHLGGEGLLTGAIRRQPFSVILFDEIEKGHPDLFDLLLQVIGEARLTDTQGRVASFAQSIIIFTSNLGSRQVSETLGFGRTGAAGTHDPTWMKAIQEFFRPEFVNRIDRIVPFDFLSTDELEQVADRMIEEIIARDGLKRRRAQVLMTPGALRRITRQDADPIYGARGMRRTLQREFVAPLSRFLATLDSRNPAVIEVTDASDRLHLQGFELKEAPEPTEGIALDSLRIEAWPKEKRLSILTTIKPALEEIHEAVMPLRPTGRFDAAGIARMSGKDRLYFRFQDEYSELRQELDEIQEFEQNDKQRISPNLPSRKFPKGHLPEYPSSTFWKRLAADIDLESALDDLFANRRHGRQDERFLNLLKRIGRLFEAVQAIDRGPQRAIWVDLQFAPDVGFEAPFEQVNDVSLLEDAWERRELDFADDHEVREIPGWQTKTAVVLQGFGAFDYWQRREGSYLLLHREQMSVRSRLVWEAAETEEEIRRSVLHRLRNSAEKWPPVTRIGRQQSMIAYSSLEHADLWPERFFLPESLDTLLR